MAESQYVTPIIFGASGLLGGHLFSHFRKHNPLTIGTYSERERADLQHFDLVQSHLDELRLDARQNYVAIICASLTNIAKINAAPEETAQVNVVATCSLMSELHARNIPVVFISTDNVFPGTSGGYKDDNTEQALSEYGIQKRIAETHLMTITDGQASILRLAKIVGDRNKDGTILNDIVQQLSSGKPVKAASDLIFNPTAITDIVNAIDYVVFNNCKGTFNFCNPKSYSRLDLTYMVASTLGMDKSRIQPVLFAELDPSGKRPLNTSMVNSELFAGFAFKSMQSCIEELVI